MTCDKCGTDVAGRMAWVREWKVVTPAGVRAEVRYTCDECEVTR